MSGYKWSEWHAIRNGEPVAWMFAYSTSQWGIDVIKSDGGYLVAEDTPPHATLAGPFDTLEAAKAAYLLIGELKNDNPTTP